MIQIKPGVRVHGIRPEIVLALMVAADLWRDNFNGTEALVVTSVIEGKHSRGSLHYSGNAIDIRTRDTNQVIIANLVTDLRTLLGEDFDVVAEGNHCHIEYDPKTAYTG